MDKKKISLILIGLIITVGALISNFIFYKSLSHITIIASKDSYAYGYAKKNMINAIVSSDSDLEKLTTKLEEFDYNIKDGEIEITGYKGISSKVIIPKFIKNMKVTSLNVEFPSETKTVVISSNISKINEKRLKNIEIYCYENNNILKENQNLNIKLLNDSDIIYFDNSSEMFSYDIKNGKITINNYLGDSNSVVIPETINGYVVEKLEFDGTGIKTMYIPKSVEHISNNLTSPIINKFFVTTIILIVMSFILYLVGVSIKKANTLTDVVYSTPKFIISIVYLILNIFLVYILRINPSEYYKYLILSISISSLYLVLIYVLANIHKNNIKFDHEINQKGDFIQEALSIADNDILIEKIKYSDPVSIDAVKSIENEIINELKTSKDNKKIEKLLEDRNRIISDNK